METFLIFLLKSSGITSLFLLFYVLLLKRETFFRANRIYLLAGLGLSILLPFVIFTKTIWLQPMPTNQHVFTNFAIEPLSKDGTIDWFSLLFYGYLSGVILLALRFFLQIISLQKLISRSNKFRDGKFKMVETDQKSSPFSFLRYVVYNPNLHSPLELKTILAHEKVHSVKKHSLDIIVMHLFTIFQWCNPFIWWYRTCLDDNLEYLADAETIAQNTNKTEYQYLLLRTGLGEKHFSLVTPFFNSSIKKRITMLNRNRSNGKNLAKFTLMVPLLLAFIFMFNIKTEAKVRAKDSLATTPIETMQDSIQIVYQINKGTTDRELADLADKIAGQGGELNIKELKRNNTGLIERISLVYKSNESGNVSGIYNDPAGIETVYFGRSGVNGQFIASDKNYKGIVLEGLPLSNLNKGMENNDTTTKFVRTYSDGKTEQNVVRRVVVDGKEKLYLNGKETTKEGLEKVNIYIDDDEPSGKGIREVEEDKGGIGPKTFETKTPLFLLDGKEVSKIDFEKLDPETFESIDVLKNQKSIEKYGDKGQHGVIEAKTKNAISNQEDSGGQDTWKVGVGLNNSNPNQSVLEYYRQMQKMAPLESPFPDIDKGLILINGVPSTKKELESIKVNRMKMLFPIAPGNKDAIKKYGNTAKFGVIEVTVKSGS